MRLQTSIYQKTIRKHLVNVDFYINTYLLREEPLEMKEGCGFRIDIYLGYFFIHKCMWSTSGTIKTTAASIKKFYRSMNEHGHISKDDYKDLCDIIKKIEKLAGDKQFGSKHVATRIAHSN